VGAEEGYAVAARSNCTVSNLVKACRVVTNDHYGAAAGIGPSRAQTGGAFNDKHSFWRFRLALDSQSPCSDMCPHRLARRFILPRAQSRGEGYLTNMRLWCAEVPPSVPTCTQALTTATRHSDPSCFPSFPSSPGHDNRSASPPEFLALWPNDTGGFHDGFRPVTRLERHLPTPPPLTLTLLLSASWAESLGLGGRCRPIRAG
jgi:hypothetical protein